MELNRYFDHTELKPQAKEEAILALCQQAKHYEFASVCVNPCHVKKAAALLAGSPVKVCTVVGFPLGANVPEIKAIEAKKAVEDGAQEVDMVINIGKAKEGDFDYIAKEVACVKAAIGDVLLKVILETCLLEDEEIVKACQACEKGNAQFVKTSTGFSKGGATTHAVALMRETVGHRLGVKASGGIHTLEEANAMIAAGANRLGCSASVAIMEELAKSK